MTQREEITIGDNPPHPPTPLSAGGEGEVILTSPELLRVEGILHAPFGMAGIPTAFGERPVIVE